jgi:hypothetical protein
MASKKKRGPKRENADTSEPPPEGQPGSGEAPLDERGFEPLPGHAVDVDADRFVCPQGDYEWWRRATGVPIPKCPNHGVRLRRAL